MIRALASDASRCKDICGKEVAVSTDPDQYFSQPRGILRLWVGILAAPTAWALQPQANYSLAALMCSPGGELATHIVSAGALVLAAVGAGTAWRNWGQTGREWRARGGRPAERSRFMALGGFFLSLLFSLAIVAQAIPTFIFSPCQ
jgi:hypothetical protein